MWSLLPFLVIAVLSALTGIVFQPGRWYRELNKPAWTPPDWLFGPAWTVLYLAIAVAGWLVWRSTGDLRTAALAWWAAQMVFNVLWSWLFFGLRRPLLALLDAILMLVGILGFIAAAYPLAPVAAYLFVPYALWVTFATLLNLAIWRRNEWSAEARAGRVS